MIKSFRHKGLAEFFATGRSKKIQANHAKKLRLILTLLNAATHPNQMAAPRFAVDVDGNTRVTFKFEDGHAHEVDYGDYH
jgi:toxin HigB-1